MSKNILRRQIWLREIESLFKECKIDKTQRDVIRGKLFEEDIFTGSSIFYVLKKEIKKIGDIEEKLRTPSGRSKKEFESKLAKLLCPELPDLYPPTDLITELNLGRELVIIAGAGVSKQLKLPDWNELAKESLEHLVETSECSHLEYEFIKREFKDPKAILSVFHKYVPLNSDKAKKFYQKTLTPKKKKENEESNTSDDKINIYELIAEFECYYVTTNIDDEFRKAVEKYLKNKQENDPLKSYEIATEVQKAERFLVPSSEFKKLEKNKIYHLHGYLDEPSKAIITTESYIEHYYSGGESAVVNFLTYLFANHPILFIGSSLSEFAILERLRGALEGQKKNENAPKHFALIPSRLNEAAEIEIHRIYLKAFGIDPVPYFIDEEGYGRLKTVLESWPKQIKEERKNNIINKQDEVDKFNKR